MSTDAAIVTVVVAGTGLLGSFWSVKTNRRGRARFLHEDMWRLQSTIARLFYQTSLQGECGESKAWLLAPLANPEAQQDVLAHLSRWPFFAHWRFSACASAIGCG